MRQSIPLPGKRHLKPLGMACLIAGGLAAAALPAVSAGKKKGKDDTVQFQAPGASKELLSQLKSASLLISTEAQGKPGAQDLLAAARADYGRLLSAFYAAGYYSPVIHILIDGKEAAGIAPLDAPTTIGHIQVQLTPGPLYHFGQTAIAPLAPGHALPKDFRTGQPALSGAVQGAADAAVKDWRDAGYAKADISGQKIVAHGQSQTLDADVTLAPGPKVRFGTLHLTGKTAVREKRLREIAGFPTGQVFSPAKEDKVAKRLRKTGVFSSVAVTEAKTVNPDGSMDVTAALVDEKKRRIGFGGELSTSNGATLTGYWLHRNLFGGAERFRIDTEVDGIGAQSGGLGYKLSARLDRPATFDPDTTAYVLGTIQTENFDDYDANNLSLGTGLSHEFNDKLTGTAGVGFEISKVTDVTGGTTYTDFNLPLGLTWDTRDKALDAHKGIYAQLGVQPFVGLNESTGSGAKLTFDLRGYKSIGKRVVLAARLQGGTIVGPSIGETPRDYLFYSGGGGTVRGQPYQSLGVYAISPTLRSGGQSFLGLSGEVRAQVWGDFGLVGFYDAGYVSAGSMFRDDGHWQAGAGVGVRYNTGIGPIRFDVGLPVSGGTGKGVQIYIGIGQAF